MSKLRDICNQNRNTSYFKKRLHDAKKLGNEWEGRDIRYYTLNQILEDENQKRQDAKEVESASQKRENKME